MMELIKELLALNEAKKNMYQVRFGHYKWDDVELDIRDLDTLAKEISMDPSGKEATEHKYQDLAELHHYVLNYHGAAEDYQKENGDIFDVVDEDYDIESFKDDVLTIKYHFTIRYGRDDNEAKYHGNMSKIKNKMRRPMNLKDPRKVEGTITLMPGN